MATHLRNRFSSRDFTEDPDHLRVFVVEGIQQAATYGVVDRFDIQRFLEFRAEYGAAFDMSPWVAKILNDRTLSGCGRMDQMDEYSLYTLRPDADE